MTCFFLQNSENYIPWNAALNWAAVIGITWKCKIKKGGKEPQGGHWYWNLLGLSWDLTSFETLDCYQNHYGLSKSESALLNSDGLFMLHGILFHSATSQ